MNSRSYFYFFYFFYSRKVYKLVRIYYNKPNKNYLVILWLESHLMRN